MANSTIVKDAPITEGLGTVYQSRVTDASVKWIKVGRIVYISGWLKTTSVVAMGSALMTGFPPAADSSYYVAQLLNTSSGANVPLIINNVGSLCIGQFRNATATTNYALNGMYISAN